MEKGITEQYIDEFGKRRAFKKDDYWFFCEPMFPLPLEISDFESNSKDAIKWCKKYNPKEHRDTKGEIMGLYFLVDSTEYYCPIEHSGEKTAFEKSYLDLREGKDSTYENFIGNKKLATLLKAYALSYYSRHSKLDYKISPRHQYDLDDLKRPYNEESTVFSDGKLVFPSKKIAESCKSFIKAFMLNDPHIMEKIALKKRPYISSMDISDYKKYYGQMLIGQDDFFKNFILAGKKERSVKTEFDLTTSEPYHLKNMDYFDGKLLYIQNAYNADSKGYERCFVILREWKNKGVNLGYFSEYENTEEQEYYDFQKDEGKIAESFICKIGETFFCVLTMK